MCATLGAAGIRTFSLEAVGQAPAREPTDPAQPAWTIGPFTRAANGDPILTPRADTRFTCPVRRPNRRVGGPGRLQPGCPSCAAAWCTFCIARRTVGRFAGTSRIAEDPDPVNRQPATLEAPVLRAGRYDLRVRPVGEAAGSFMGVAPHDPESRELYARASPLAHVTRSAPSTLLLHGDSDDVVPFEQSVAMDEALRHHGVPARLVRVAGGEHGATFGSPDSPHPQLPETFEKMVAWLDQHLSGPQTRSRN